MKLSILGLVLLFGLAMSEITPSFPGNQPLILDASGGEYEAPSPSSYLYDFEEKILIDDFTTETIALIVITPPGGAPPSVSDSSFDSGSDILGTERDVILVAIEGDGNQLLAAGTSVGLFTISTPPNASGDTTIQWDGVDGSEALDSEVGLGGIDFTVGFGMVFSAESDLPTEFDLTICSTGSVCDSVTVQVDGGSVIQDFVVDFTEFSSLVDFTSVSAVAFEIQSFTAVDFTLDTVAVIGDIGSVTLGGGAVCGSVLPCDTVYYRFQTLTDVQPNNYLRLEFNQTGEAGHENSIGAFYIQGSNFDDLQNELLTNNEIQDTLGELPGPDNFLYRCLATTCDIEIAAFLENKTYYVAVAGGNTGITEFCFNVFLREVEVVEIFDRTAVPVFLDQRPTTPPDDRILHYSFYSIDIPENTFSEGTYLTVNISRAEPFPGLGMALMYEALPEFPNDVGVIDQADFDSNGRDVDDTIYDFCVNTTRTSESVPFFDNPQFWQPRVPCECFTNVQVFGDGPAFQLTCNLTVDPCHFRYGRWYVAVELPERSAPSDPLDTSGTANYTLTAFVSKPFVTTLFRNVTFKGFVEPERMTHYKINVPAQDVDIGESHLFTQVSNVRNGFVDIYVHQGLGPTMNLAGGGEACVPANATCRTCAACNVVIEKCHFTPGTWYISVAVAYDVDDNVFHIDDPDRLPITYTIRSTWLEDATPTRLLAGSPVTSWIGEALYDFYVVDVPPTIDTWLFVELYAKAEDTEVIISMLHGALPGGECYERPDFYCLTGDPREENANQRESCQFMIQTCELEAGPLFISVYGHHIGYSKYGDNTFYQVPVHYTLYVDFDVALAINSGESYSENVFERQYQHYYIRADDVAQGSSMSVELTNIQHGVPQTLEGFINYNFLAGNCPCYDHLYNCTGAQDPSCNGDVAPNEPNFLPEPDTVSTCCTMLVPACDFRSGVWYVSVLGLNEDLVQHTTPIGYTLTVTIYPAPEFNPLLLGQAEVNEVPQWNKTLEYTHYKLAAAPFPLNDLVLQLTYVQNCEFNEKHDNIRDELVMYVNKNAPAGERCSDYTCTANLLGESYCTVVIPHCDWDTSDIFVAIQGNYDAVLNARYTLRASSEEVRDVQLFANVAHQDHVSEGRYKHYFIDVVGNEDQYLAFDLFANHDQDTISAFMNVNERAGDSPCFRNVASCIGQSSCWWQIEACEITRGRYYVSVFGNPQFYDIPVEYTLTASLKSVTTRVGNGDPVTGHIQVGEIQHYKFSVQEVVEGDFLVFEIDNLKHGSVVVYENFGFLAGRCPCYLSSKTCVADSDEERWCDIRVDPCELQVGDYFFAVVGLENKTPEACLFDTAIGYTLEINQIRPFFIDPQVDVGRDVDNTEVFQFVANGRYNHYEVSIDDDDFGSGYHIIVEITSVRDGALFVYYQGGFPADESEGCHTANLCTSGLGAGSECFWQIPYCLARPLDGGRKHYISIEGKTGRLQASYNILIYKQPVPVISENVDFSLDNITSSFFFPAGTEYNATHVNTHEPNGWTQFVRLADVAHTDPDRGDILELFFYRVVNNVGQPTSFNVYVHPNEPAGAHECCSGSASELGSCQGAPCSESADTTTEGPFPGSAVFSHTCSLPDGVGADPTNGDDPFFGQRCTVRVWACEFNKYCFANVTDWFVSVVPISASDADVNAELPGLQYSLQWRTRATRLDEQGLVDSIDLTPIVNSYEYSQEYTLFNPSTETDDFISFFVDMTADTTQQRRLSVQTDFTTGSAIVYIKRDSPAQEFANPTDTCNEYSCSTSDFIDCSTDGRFLVSDCCSLDGGRWFITVRNTGGNQASASVRFRITEITQSVLLQIPDHPSEAVPFIATSGFLNLPDGTDIDGLQGEKYDYYVITVDDDDLDDHQSLVLDLFRTDDDDTGGFIQMFVLFGTPPGDFAGSNQSFYDGDEGCHGWQYTCDAVSPDGRCTMQLPACQLIEGHWYIAIYNPVFDFGPGPVTTLPEYELEVFIDAAPIDLTLNTVFQADDEDFNFRRPGTLQHYRVNVTAADIEYDDRTDLEGYYTNWLRFQITNVTSNPLRAWVNYGDLAGRETDEVVCLGANIGSAICDASGCFFDVLPCEVPGLVQKLVTGEYFFSVEVEGETGYHVEALILSDTYDQITLTETITGTGHREGTTNELYRHTVTSGELLVDGDGFGNYRYVIDLTSEEGDDDGFADNEYVNVNITLDANVAAAEGISLSMWRDDCTRWSCQADGPNSWCTIDALELAPCTLKGGRFHFDVFNPSALNFTLSLYHNETTVQTLQDTQVITEIVFPYEYQEYFYEAVDVLEGATLEVEICSICGNVEAWLRPDLPAGPGPSISGDANACGIDYCSTTNGDVEIEFDDDDDLDCCTMFLDTCQYEQRGYYIGIRGVTQEFPSVANENLYLPIKYQISATQTNVNVTDISFLSCAKTIRYYEEPETAPRQYAVNLETVNCGETVRFSMRLPSGYTSNGETANMVLNLNSLVGYTADCDNSEYTCSIAPGQTTCDFVIPACNLQAGRYFIWADAPRGSEILVERWDPYVPMIDANLEYSATINGPSNTAWDLPYRPARQYYRLDVVPPEHDENFYEKFFMRLRFFNVEQGTIAASVNTGNSPAYDEFGADCGSPVFWNDVSCQDVGEGEECFIDIQLSDLDFTAEDDHDHDAVPTTFWVAISGVQQQCELHSIKYSFVAQTNWVLTYFPLDRTICNTVEEDQYNFHRLRPRAGENPQSSILHINIKDIDVVQGEEVEFLLNDGHLATLDGSDLAVRSGRDADANGGEIDVDWICGYNDLYMSVYGLNADDVDQEIDYLMNVTKVPVRVHELFNDDVFHMDDDDDDMCPHEHDYFIFKARAPNGGFRSSFLRVLVDSECPVEVWVNKHTFAWGPCSDSAHGDNFGSGSVNLYDFCDYEDTNYYITVQSECAYYIYTDVRDDAQELEIGEVFRDSVEPGMYQMYTLEVCEDWFEADDRLVVEIADVQNGNVEAWIRRDANPGVYQDTSDDGDGDCALTSAFASFGEQESSYDYLLVDSCDLVAGTYHILIRASTHEGSPERNCEHVSFRLYPYLVDYEIDPADLAVNTQITDSLDFFRVDRAEEDSLNRVNHYMITPFAREDGFIDFVSFAQARLANVQGGEVRMRVMCGHLATPEFDFISGSRQALTVLDELFGFEIQSGRRPDNYQRILDPHNSLLAPDATGCADYQCDSGDLESCALFIPSCYWDIKDWVMFFVSVEVISQDYQDHPVTYDLTVDQYHDFTLIQPNTNRVGQFDGNFSYDFYWSLQAEVESARWRVVVTDGEGVHVTVRNHRCPEQATWEKEIWCDADYFDQPWMCDIEIPTECAHPGDDAFFLEVGGSNATYSIAYWRGRENCHDFTGTGRSDGLDFCAGLVPYATWRWDDYSHLDDEAHCFFNELYEHFRVQPCWSGVTPECNATLQRFACYESFRRCDENGFYVGTCQKACEAVVYECVNHFESVDLEHYNCTSDRYIDERFDTCTGSDLFESFSGNSVNFLGNPDLLLFSPSPSDAKEFSSSASTLTASTLLAVVTSLIALFFM